MSSKPERRSRARSSGPDAILTAAARLFSRQGYAASTMQQIADEAGYTVPTLYSYFDGKEDIFESLVLLVERGLFSILDEHLPPGIRFEDRVEILLRRLYAWADEQSDTVTFFLRLSSGLDAAPLPDEDKSQPDPFHIKLTEWMRRAVEADPSATQREPEVLATALSALANAFAKDSRSGLSTPLVDRVPVVLELFLSGVKQRAEPARAAVAASAPKTRKG